MTPFLTLLTTYLTTREHHVISAISPRYGGKNFTPNHVANHVGSKSSGCKMKVTTAGNHGDAPSNYTHPQYFTLVSFCYLTTVANHGAPRFLPRKKTLGRRIYIIYNIIYNNIILQGEKTRMYVCAYACEAREAPASPPAKSFQKKLHPKEKFLIYDFVISTKMINFAPIKSLTTW